jgi:hypothetical protein
MRRFITDASHELRTPFDHHPRFRRAVPKRRRPRRRVLYVLFRYRCSIGSTALEGQRQESVALAMRQSDEGSQRRRGRPSLSAAFMREGKPNRADFGHRDSSRCHARRARCLRRAPGRIAGDRANSRQCGRRSMGIDNSVIAGPSSAIAASEGGEWAQSRCVQALDDLRSAGINSDMCRNRWAKPRRRGIARRRDVHSSAGYP